MVPRSLRPARFRARASPLRSACASQPAGLWLGHGACAASRGRRSTGLAGLGSMALGSSGRPKSRRNLKGSWPPPRLWRLFQTWAAWAASAGSTPCWTSRSRICFEVKPPCCVAAQASNLSWRNSHRAQSPVGLPSFCQGRSRGENLPTTRAGPPPPGGPPRCEVGLGQSRSSLDVSVRRSSLHVLSSLGDSGAGVAVHESVVLCGSGLRRCRLGLWRPARASRAS